jgi:hypothetical protein
VVLDSYWRIFSGLHTTAQVAVGATLGSLVGFLWEGACRDHIGRRVAEMMPYPKLPVEYVLAVMVVGALTVGSVERKIAKLVKKVVRREGPSVGKGL